jgi:hypothetical protein
VCGEGDAWTPFADAGVTYVTALLQDGQPSAITASEPDFAALLERALPLMRATLDAGNSVLVHCASGAHRSASVVAAYLMTTLQKPLDDVFPIIFAKRQLAMPVYWEYLVRVVEPPIFDALGQM